MPLGEELYFGKEKTIRREIRALYVKCSKASAVAAANAPPTMAIPSAAAGGHNQSAPNAPVATATAPNTSATSGSSTTLTDLQVDCAVQRLTINFARLVSTAAAKELIAPVSPSQQQQSPKWKHRMEYLLTHVPGLKQPASHTVNFPRHDVHASILPHLLAAQEYTTKGSPEAEDEDGTVSPNTEIPTKLFQTFLAIYSESGIQSSILGCRMNDIALLLKYREFFATHLTMLVVVAASYVNSRADTQKLVACLPLTYLGYHGQQLHKDILETVVDVILSRRPVIGFSSQRVLAVPPPQPPQPTTTTHDTASGSSGTAAGQQAIAGSVATARGKNDGTSTATKSNKAKGPSSAGVSGDTGSRSTAAPTVQPPPAAVPSHHHHPSSSVSSASNLPPQQPFPPIATLSEMFVMYLLAAAGGENLFSPKTAQLAATCNPDIVFEGFTSVQKEAVKPVADDCSNEQQSKPSSEGKCPFGHDADKTATAPPACPYAASASRTNNKRQQFVYIPVSFFDHHFVAADRLGYLSKFSHKIGTLVVGSAMQMLPSSIRKNPEVFTVIDALDETVTSLPEVKAAIATIKGCQVLLADILLRISTDLALVRGTITSIESLMQFNWKNVHFEVTPALKKRVMMMKTCRAAVLMKTTMGLYDMAMNAITAGGSSGCPHRQKAERDAFENYLWESTFHTSSLQSAANNSSSTPPTSYTAPPTTLEENSLLIEQVLSKLREALLQCDQYYLYFEAPAAYAEFLPGHFSIVDDEHHTLIERMSTRQQRVERVMECGGSQGLSELLCRAAQTAKGHHAYSHSNEHTEALDRPILYRTKYAFNVSDCLSRIKSAGCWQGIGEDLSLDELSAVVTNGLWLILPTPTWSPYSEGGAVSSNSNSQVSGDGNGAVNAPLLASHFNRYNEGQQSTNHGSTNSSQHEQPGLPRGTMFVDQVLLTVKGQATANPAAYVSNNTTITTTAESIRFLDPKQRMAQLRRRAQAAAAAKAKTAHGSPFNLDADVERLDVCCLPAFSKPVPVDVKYAIVRFSLTEFIKPVVELQQSGGAGAGGVDGTTNTNASGGANTGSSSGVSGGGHQASSTTGASSITKTGGDEYNHADSQSTNRGMRTLRRALHHWGMWLKDSSLEYVVLVPNSDVLKPEQFQALASFTAAELRNTIITSNVAGKILFLVNDASKFASPQIKSFIRTTEVNSLWGVQSPAELKRRLMDPSHAIKINDIDILVTSLRAPTSASSLSASSGVGATGSSVGGAEAQDCEGEGDQDDVTIPVVHQKQNRDFKHMDGLVRVHLTKRRKALAVGYTHKIEDMSAAVVKPATGSTAYLPGPGSKCPMATKAARPASPTPAAASDGKCPFDHGKVDVNTSTVVKSCEVEENVEDGDEAKDGEDVQTCPVTGNVAATEDVKALPKTGEHRCPVMYHQHKHQAAAAAAAAGPPKLSDEILKATETVFCDGVYLSTVFKNSFRFLPSPQRSVYDPYDSNKPTNYCRENAAIVMSPCAPSYINAVHRSGGRSSDGIWQPRDASSSSSSSAGSLIPSLTSGSGFRCQILTHRKGLFTDITPPLPVPFQEVKYGKFVYVPSTSSGVSNSSLSDGSYPASASAAQLSYQQHLLASQKWALSIHGPLDNNAEETVYPPSTPDDLDKRKLDHATDFSLAGRRILMLEQTTVAPHSRQLWVMVAEKHGAKIKRSVSPNTSNASGGGANEDVLGPLHIVSALTSNPLEGDTTYGDEQGQNEASVVDATALLDKPVGSRPLSRLLLSGVLMRPRQEGLGGVDSYHNLAMIAEEIESSAASVAQVPLPDQVSQTVAPAPEGSEDEAAVAEANKQYVEVQRIQSWCIVRVPKLLTDQDPNASSSSAPAASKSHHHDGRARASSTTSNGTGTATAASTAATATGENSATQEPAQFVIRAALTPHQQQVISGGGKEAPLTHVYLQVALETPATTSSGCPNASDSTASDTNNMNFIDAVQSESNRLHSSSRFKLTGDVQSAARFEFIPM